MNKQLISKKSFLAHIEYDRIISALLVLLIIMTSFFFAPNALAFSTYKAKKSKKIVSEIQKKAPDDTEYFEKAFPRPEQLIEEERHTGSLWVDSYSSHLYKNLHRASRIGDMVTVIIAEEATGTETAQTKTERTSEHNLNIGGLFGMLSKLTSTITGLDPAQTIDVQHDNAHEGKGETRRKGSLEARVTARVVKVLRNGDMMIRGQKNIKVNDEDQALIVEGFIRPYDISANNTIMSTYIADARIVLSGFGTVADKQKPGWFTRILDHILPF